MAFWEKETTITTIQKGNGDEIQVKSVSKKNKDYVDIRTFYHNDDGELAPGKGISIPADCVPDIIAAILKADIEIRMDVEAELNA